MWEIFSFGATPYQDLNLQQVFNCIKVGHILERPLDTPGTIYSLMVQCWDRKPVSLESKVFFHDM